MSSVLHVITRSGAHAVDVLARDNAPERSEHGQGLWDMSRFVKENNGARLLGKLEVAGMI